MSEQAARKIILVTLVAAAVVAAAGPPVAASPSTTSTGTCLIISSDPVAVGVNPDCRPIGTGLPCDLNGYIHLWSHAGSPETATYFGANLPGPNAELGMSLAPVEGGAGPVAFIDTFALRGCLV